MRRIGGVGGLGALWVIAALMLWPQPAHAGGIGYSAGAGIEFATGKYGTGVTTDSLFMPFTVIAYPTGRLDFSLEIPYVRQSTRTVVTGQYAGMQAQTAGAGSGMAGMGGSMGFSDLFLSALTKGANGSRYGLGATDSRASHALNTGMAAMGGPMGASGLPASSEAAGDTADGLGDIRLRAGYVLYTEERYVPGIRPSVSVKIPTADKDKLLGTGALDGGFAVELYKWFGAWFADGEAGYTVQGNSTVVATRNYMSYYAGLGYQLTDNLRAMALLKGATPTVEDGPSFLEGRLRMKYRMTRNAGLDGYLSKGINEASPDYGMGLSVFYDF